jgi:hypothetical protein
MFLISQASRLTLGFFQLSGEEALPQKGSSWVLKLTNNLHLTQSLRKYGSEIVLLQGRYTALKSSLMRTFREILLVLSTQVL